MAILTKKFSEFIAGSLNNPNQIVGLSAGANARFSGITTWTTLTRPTTPGLGQLGYNSTLGQYEFYDNVVIPPEWVQLEDSNDISTLLALLASHVTGEGASLIGLENQGSVSNKTVQDLAEASFIVKTNNSSLVNAQVLADLTSGILSVTQVTGVVASRILTGTSNQINIVNGNGAGNPTYTLSSTLDFPGTYTVQGSTVIDEIIDDDTMATATDSNLATAESIVAYVNSTGSGTVNAGLINQLAWYAASGTTVSGLATSASGLLVTSAGSVPSIATDIPIAVTIGSAYIYRVGGNDVATTDGGTGIGTYTLGDIIYSSSANVLSKLAGNTTIVKQYLSQTGTGVVSAAPAWATIDGGDITGAALSKTDDTNVTMTLGGTPTTALLRAASMTLGWTGQLSLARGGTNANLTASNGGIFYSTATAAAILAGTATANQILMSGASSTPAWSTSTYPATATGTGTLLRADGTNWSPTTTTYPATNAINTMMYASSANILGVIAAANSSVLVSSAGGVPSWSTTLPTGLTIPGFAHSGANSDITSMTGLTGVLQAPTAIASSAGLNALAFTYTASAVNYLTLANAATLSSPGLTATGTDADIGIIFQIKGSSAVAFLGTASVPAQVQLYEQTTNGTNYIGLKAPAALGANIIYQLPGTDGSANYPLLTNGSAVLSFGILPVAGGGTGVVSSNPVIQRVNTQTGAVATGTTIMPYDDSVPQSGEGDEYMTLAITPKNSANKLKIEVAANTSSTAVTGNVISMALFQDATAGALAAVNSGTLVTATGTIVAMPPLVHTMTAGTTSATTFKIRIGASAAGTTTFNGAGGARFFGGVIASSITITEYSS